MSIENFPSNSHSRKASQTSGNSPQPTDEEKPKLEPVVTGKVIHRKKSFGRKVLDTFFKGEGGVISYLAHDVLIPALQNLVIDTVTEGIQRAVGGSTGRQYRTFRGSGQARTHHNYNGYSANRTTISSTSPLIGNGPQPRRSPMMQSSSVDLEDIVVETDFEAEMIIEKLYEAQQEFGAATVANLKELTKTSPTYVDHKWGWPDGVEFGKKRVRVEGGIGVLLIIPEPVVVR